MSISVREAKDEDAATVVSLIDELAGGEGEQSPVYQTYVLEYLAVDGNKVLLAERDGEAVGLISCSIRPNLYHAANSCLIEELIVREEAQDEGIGSMLIEEVIKRCIAGGCAEISVSTMPGNKRAIAFYKKLGFVDEALFLERHLDV
jgi:ribosomal protein S18 acetylase RimI-like enzyme